MSILTFRDFRNAARSLARTPTVTFSAIFSLSLGIGATAALSSAVSRALLQPPPFRAPERMIAVFRTTPNSGPDGTWPQSAPNYVDLAQQTHALSGLAALAQGSALVTLRDDAVQATRLLVTGNLFPMLGIRPLAGRLIAPADDQPSQPPVAVISEEFWRAKLGGDRSVIDRTMIIDGSPVTVIGITPFDFRVPVGTQILRADIWMPARFTPQQLSQRGSNYLQLVGRLADGATVETAHAELHSLFGRLVETYPDLRGEEVRVESMQAASTAQLRTPLLLLFAAVCMVLLIAGMNVAAILLARGVRARRETAIRTALGASRWDAMRPPLAESLLIASVGGAIGLGLAWAGVRTIGSLAAARLPQLAGLSIDARVIAFSVLLVIVIAAVCGAAPAWRASTVDPQDALRGGRSAADGRDTHSALRSLVVFEIGLSLVLLISAGLVLKGFTRLLANNPGFDPSGMLSLRVAVSPTKYPNQNAARDFLDPALDAIRTIPGVESAGAISHIPYVSWGSNSNVRYEGRPNEEPSKMPLVEFRSATPGFFQVTKQPVLAGRLLQASDDESRTAPAVVVVSDALAKRDFQDGNVVGKRFYLTDTSFATIVGVVGDIRNAGPIAAPRPEMYFPYRQGNPGSTVFPIVVRVARGDPLAIARDVREAIHKIDPSAAVTSVLPMPEVIAKSLGQPRFYFTLLGAFAVVAVVLSVAGLYGILSYVVAQRTRELGIRTALGASSGSLVGLVTGDGMLLVGAGLVLGMMGALAATRVLTFMFYGVSPLDVPTWCAAIGILGIGGLAASILPARRATRIDPVLAIRTE